MATPTIITTPGASDANSYADVADAGSYFDTHLYRDNWVGSYEDEQTRALLLATRLLDTELRDLTIELHDRQSKKIESLQGKIEATNISIGKIQGYLVSPKILTRD